MVNNKLDLQLLYHCVIQVRKAFNFINFSEAILNLCGSGKFLFFFVNKILQRSSAYANARINSVSLVVTEFHIDCKVSE